MILHWEIVSSGVLISLGLKPQIFGYKKTFITWYYFYTSCVEKLEKRKIQVDLPNVYPGKINCGIVWLLGLDAWKRWELSFAQFHAMTLSIASQISSFEGNLSWKIYIVLFYDNQNDVKKICNAHLNIKNRLSFIFSWRTFLQL